MRQSKFTETQIVSILNEADAGRPVNEIWRKYSISSATPTAARPFLRFCSAYNRGVGQGGPVTSSSERLVLPRRYPAFSVAQPRVHRGEVTPSSYTEESPHRIVGGLSRSRRVRELPRPSGRVEAFLPTNFGVEVAEQRTTGNPDGFALPHHVIRLSVSLQDVAMVLPVEI